jgi:hypothetical protein
MNVELNHTIVWCGDKQKSASFLVEILDLERPVKFGPMLIVRLSNAVSLDFYEQEGKISCNTMPSWWVTPDLPDFRASASGSSCTGDWDNSGPVKPRAQRQPVIFLTDASPQCDPTLRNRGGQLTRS